MTLWWYISGVQVTGSLEFQPTMFLVILALAVISVNSAALRRPDEVNSEAEVLVAKETTRDPHNYMQNCFDWLDVYDHYENQLGE